jgi:hypothetical protein
MFEQINCFFKGRLIKIDLNNITVLDKFDDDDSP